MCYFLQHLVQQPDFGDVHSFGFLQQANVFAQQQSLLSQHLVLPVQHLPLALQQVLAAWCGFADPVCANDAPAIEAQSASVTMMVFI